MTDQPEQSKTSGAPPDLSAEIARVVTRDPGQSVTCRRVAPHHYRCNWWAAQSTTGYDNPGMKGLLVTTSRVCRSLFLHVTKSGDKLVITVVPSTDGKTLDQIL